MVRASLRALFLAGGLSAAAAQGAVTYSVTFDDPAGALASVRTLIEQHVVAAGQRWNRSLAGDAAIEVVVKTSTAIPYAEGRSLASSLVRNNGAFDVFEQGMAAEVKTGVDPNGGTPDVEILLNPDYAINELWYDPDPAARSAIVDVNRTDAMSTFLHEFGHALGFGGWINGTTGTFPGDYQSTYDERIRFDGDNFFFTGPEAVAVNGTEPALTFANVAHVANYDPRPGTNLQLDLMNGLFFYRGYRYDVSPIDVAILRDSGVPALYRAGDYDVNRIVDGADVLLWQTQLGASTATRGGADGDASADVGAGDLDVWQARFGETIPASAAARVVPEPTRNALAGVTAVAGANFRRGRSRRCAHRARR